MGVSVTKNISIMIPRAIAWFPKHQKKNGFQTGYSLLVAHYINLMGPDSIFKN